MGTKLWAVADLHAAVPKNAALVATLKPENPEDWLIVAGDVAEEPSTVIATLEQLKRHYAEVIWAPGNHELFGHKHSQSVGKARYDYLLDQCRQIGVRTPEDPYLQFAGHTIVPLFTLYDYTFRAPGTTAQQAIAAARAANRILLDDIAIAPYVDIQAWCWERLTYSVRRLSTVHGPTILVNHWPLIAEPLQQLHIPEIALWSGSIHTRSWPRRFQATQVIYGHLHIPGTLEVDAIAHHEVSLGYPYQWKESLSHRHWPHLVVEDA